MYLVNAGYKDYQYWGNLELQYLTIDIDGCPSSAKIKVMHQSLISSLPEEILNDEMNEIREIPVFRYSAKNNTLEYWGCESLYRYMDLPVAVKDTCLPEEVIDLGF